MKKKNFMITALILTACVTAALASCGGRNDTPANGSDNGERVTEAVENNKETAGGIVNDVIDGAQNIGNDVINGAENIGNDIADSIKNPEDATHGTEENVTDRTENSMIADGNDDAMRHRPAVPYGK